MNYCNALDNKSHIKILLSWLYEECNSSGGDGDALWYSRFYNTEDIFPILKEFNHSLAYPYKTVELIEGDINWGQEQEWILITNKIEKLQNSPEWIQAKIIW